MAKVKITGVRKRGSLRRTLLTVVVVAALAVAVYLKRDVILQVVEALMSGAVMPLVAGACFEMGRIVFHGLAYTRSFRVIGANVPLRDTVPAWFKAVFMNTVLPSGGTSGLACVIDTARKRGVAVGSATTATLFTQTCFYLAMFLIILLGFGVMARSGTLTPRDVAVGSIMGVAACAFVALLAAGHLAPSTLQTALRAVERLVVRICKKLPFIKKTPEPWADNLVHSFSKASTVLVRNPGRASTVFFSMAVAMTFDALAFMASGYAFNVTRLDALFGAYVMALVFNSFNVTPGGAGIVEGLAAAVLAGYGFPLTQALSVILVYRAFMYWGPLVVGGVMMRVTGAFTGPAETAEELNATEVEVDGERVQRQRGRVGLRLREVAGTEAGVHSLVAAALMTAAAVTGIVVSFGDPDPLLYDAVSNVVLGWSPFPSLGMVVCGALVLLCVPGTILRDAGNWLLSILALILLGFSCVLAAHGVATVALCLGAQVSLAIWHESFCRHPYWLLWSRLKSRRQEKKDE